MSEMISVVYKSGRYRELLDRMVGDGDVVIEIGPHIGSATKRYCSRTALTVAMDIGPQSEAAFRGIREKTGTCYFTGMMPGPLKP